MTPDIERVYANYHFPFRPRKFQVKPFDFFKDRTGVGGLFLWVGLGKTYVASLIAMHQTIAHGVTRIMAIVPPSLDIQWRDWFMELGYANGDPFDVSIYQGTPAQRKKMTFNHDIIVIPQTIFRKDYQRIEAELLLDPNIFVIYDEAHQGLRVVGNKIFQYFKEFVQNKPALLLTATPVNTPEDVFALTELVNPGAYRSRGHFERLHVTDYDYRGKPVEWENLDIMSKNLYKGSFKLEATDEIELPKVVYTQVKYELDPRHQSLYNQLKKECWLELDNGKTINGMQANRLYNLLQQMVTCPTKLGVEQVNEKMLDVLLTICREDENEKIVIFGHFKNTNRYILEKLNESGFPSVGCWGDFTRAQQDKHKQAWLHDRGIKGIVGYFDSLGTGTDGMQKVCNRMVFVELPKGASRFRQCTGRIDRQGQVKPYCDVKVMTAKNTIQTYLYEAIKNKDDLIKMVVRNKQCLRDLLA